jgi:hypothetical protein
LDEFRAERKHLVDPNGLLLLGRHSLGRAAIVEPESYRLARGSAPPISGYFPPSFGARIAYTQGEAARMRGRRRSM